MLAALAAIAVAGLPGVATGAPDARLARDAERLVRSRLPHGTTAVYVADLETGAAVLEIEPDAPLNPASNVKLIATGTSLELLGADYRYVTRVLGDVPDANGRARGDLYLLGGHDPTLDRAALRDLALRLRALGLTSLEGGVAVGRPSRDGVGHAVIEVTVDGRGRRGPRVTTDDTTGFVTVVHGVRVTRGRTRLVIDARVAADASPRLVIEVDGAVRRGARVTRKVVAPAPAILAAFVLRDELVRAGVEVRGGVRVAPVHDYAIGALHDGYLPLPIAEHASAPLAEIVATVNKRSVNWLADRLVTSAVARHDGGPAAMTRGIDAMRAWMADRGVRVDDIVLDTGSGLSYRTRLSARQLVAIVRATMDDPVYRASLPIGGVDGTLARRFPRLSNRVRAKTGTLTGIIALTGTLALADGRPLAFSIITNGHREGRRAAVRRAHEQLLRLVARRLDARR